MIAVPAAFAFIRPVWEIATTELLSVLQVIPLLLAFEGYTVARKV